MKALYYGFGLWLIASNAYGYDQQALTQLIDHRECNGCDLSRAPLKDSQLTHVHLRWANLQYADLRGADLSGADLTGANLSHAMLEGTSLRRAVLEGANLFGTQLSETLLSGADLRWSDLTHLDLDMDLEFVDLVGVQLQGARFKNGLRCGPFPAKGGWGCVTEPAKR